MHRSEALVLTKIADYCACFVEILVTGGAGYIGAHTVVSLQQRGHDVVVVDDLSRGSKAAIDRAEIITGHRVQFYCANVRDRESLKSIFGRHDIRAVLHLAGYKSITESMSDPLKYYDNNIASTVALCSVMKENGVRRLVFSSSATVYGAQRDRRSIESMRTAPSSPYGRTKDVIERLLMDLSATNEGWQITSLRYFNPVGAHISGMIGEDHRGQPTNLLPLISQVALGLKPHLKVFGGDFETPDGTGIRDYVHVVDVAEGHAAALGEDSAPNVARTFNLGTGKGSSVREVIATFESATQTRVPFEVVGRRSGDIDAIWADTTMARASLRWSAKRTLHEACVDHWRWQTTNPNGYDVSDRSTA